MNEAEREKNAAYQRDYRAKIRGEEPGRRGVRLDVVLSQTTKKRLKELAEAQGESQKFTLELIIKQAHDLLNGK